MAAGPPRESLPVPRRVLALAAGRLVNLVWRNELGGLTYEIGSGADRVFCKWTQGGQSHLATEAERVRLNWAGAWGRVPEVLSHGADAAGSWLVTRALAGENAVSGRWRGDPASAVKAMGAGLRAFHDRLPVDGCPFWAAPAVLLPALRKQAALGQVQRAAWHPSHRELEVHESLARLADPPEVDRLVVCHGDATGPNTLIDDEGECSGHVDLGALGVADRWSDLAIATWSAQWNFGPGFEGALLDAYGVSPDPQRTRYYRLLWDLT